jgi:Raf kinase inhibitor-like YbhB/YbcL family protein
MAGRAANFEIYSDDFENGADMPIETTQFSTNRSPHLAWRNAPTGTQSLVVIVLDPDAPDSSAPARTNTHWVLYDLDPSMGSIEAIAAGVPPGAKVGLNYALKPSYAGPRPVAGRHRYFHWVYALDNRPEFPSPPTLGDLYGAMQGHILGATTLVGIAAAPPPD